jgi:MFS family permease
VLVVASIIDRLGRTRTQTILYILSGIAAAAMGHLSPSPLLIAVAGLGRLLIMGASAATWVATPELFPTRIRVTGHALSNAFSRIGAALSPYLIQGSSSVTKIGIVLCILNFIAASATSMLPETSGASQQ